MTVQGAGQAGQHAADGEREQLPAHRVHPHRLRRLLVVADGAQVKADAGLEDLVYRPERERRGHQQQEIIGKGIGGIEDQRRVQAQIAPGPFVFRGDEQPVRFGEGPGGQGQVDLAHFQGQPAQQSAHQTGGQHADGNAQPQRNAAVDHQQGRGVASDGGEGVRCQGELAGKSGQQVPADGQNDVVESDRIDVDEIAAEDERQHRGRRHDDRQLQQKLLSRAGRHELRFRSASRG